MGGVDVERGSMVLPGRRDPFIFTRQGLKKGIGEREAGREEDTLQREMHTINKRMLVLKLTGDLRHNLLRHLYHHLPTFKHLIKLR